MAEALSIALLYLQFRPERFHFTEISYAADTYSRQRINSHWIEAIQHTPKIRPTEKKKHTK